MDAIQGVRRQLLDLHRALVDAERREYERARGRLPHRKFLEALLTDPELAWLKPLTALLVRLDELLEDDSAREPGERDTCVATIRVLLKPDAQGAEFQRRYADALQRSPDVAVAHGRTVSALQATQAKARTQP